MDAEIIWRDPESRTTGEQTDAGVKELALGVPEEIIWRRRLGMTPQEIQRAKAMKAEAALLAPPAPPVVGPGSGPVPGPGSNGQPPVPVNGLT